MPSFQQLLLSKTVLFSIILAIISVLQGYVFLLPITPIHQMLVGIVVSVVVSYTLLIPIKLAINVAG